jgi:hypothetical protein
MKHASQFFKDVISIIFCQLIFRIGFLEDTYPDIGQSLVVSPWSTRALGPLWRSYAFNKVTPSGLGLVEVPVKVCPCLGVPAFPSSWVPVVPAWPTHAFFSFPIVYPDSFVHARWSMPTSEARCLRPSPSAGVLELLASCIGVSELLTLERRGLDITSGRFFTSESSLPMAETSAVDSLVAPVPLCGVPELLVAC